MKAGYILVRWLSVVVGSANGFNGALYVFAFLDDSRFTGQQLPYVVTSWVMMVSTLAIFATFFFKRGCYIYMFACSSVAALCFIATTYGSSDLEYVMLWGPWLIANGACMAGLWKYHSAGMASAPGVEDSVKQPYGRVHYDRFIVPIKIEQLAQTRRIHFAASKDNDWIANGMVVTISTEQQIVAIDFVSREFGVARWSAAAGTTIEWEASGVGRAKWRAALSLPFAKSGLDRKVVIDVLRLIENSELRQALDECIDGTPTVWKPVYEVGSSIT